MCSYLIVVLNKIRIPEAILALILDSNYDFYASKMAKNTASEYLKYFAENLKLTYDDTHILMMEFNNFVNSSKYPKLGNRQSLLQLISRRILSCTTNSMSCERTFSIMGWIKSSRRNRLSINNLIAYTKGYMALKDASVVQSKLIETAYNKEVSNVTGAEADISFIQNDKSVGDLSLLSDSDSVEENSDSEDEIKAFVEAEDATEFIDGNVKEYSNNIETTNSQEQSDENDVILLLKHLSSIFNDPKDLLTFPFCEERNTIIDLDRFKSLI